VPALVVISTMPDGSAVKPLPLCIVQYAMVTESTSAGTAIGGEVMDPKAVSHENRPARWIVESRTAATSVHAGSALSAPAASSTRKFDVMPPAVTLNVGGRATAALMSRRV
jgi:hypothetical protein